MTRIAIDPITRIDGHLRIEVEVTNGVVRDAWSSGTMFRGMERILRGRDPRNAWLLAQRICGACTGVHALASVRAVENALGLTIPRNARLIRNLLAGSQQVQDHVVHFYHQHALDWVDVASATTADPSATSILARSISDTPLSSPTYFLGVRDKLVKFMQSGQLGPFGNAYWGHPAYTLPPEVNLLVMTHYLEALDWQRKLSRIQTLLGGKYPHPQTYLVGGMAVAPPWGGPTGGLPGEHPQQVDPNAPAALNARGLSDLAALLAEAKTFVDQVFVPDVLAVAGHYRDWAGIGTGIGNYLSYGEFPEDDSSQPLLLMPRGRIINRNLAKVEPVDQSAIAETVAHSYYTYDGGGDALRHPANGQTNPAYAGPKPPVTTLAGSDKYSWLKAPRYQEEPMEVGPLARILVAYVEGQVDVRTTVNGVVAKLAVGPDALFSTLGRIVARAIEAQVVVDRLDGWLKDLTANLATGDLAVADLSRWDPGTWPNEAQGWALGEAPRGALGHWVKIRDGRIDEYQVVDATTWNGSPRDATGQRGALEEALVGTPVTDPAMPVEILRTVHSFDPCAACAVHAYDPDAAGSVEIRVV
jgi:[NiFe] hydrogenase large subunit/hydrogenase large subunit